MNKLNYFLLVFLSLFVLTSIVVKPKSFEDYFKLDIDATIPEESFNGDIQKKQNTSFDIEAFSSALEKEEKVSSNFVKSTLDTAVTEGWTKTKTVEELRKSNEKITIKKAKELVKDAFDAESKKK